jgi:zinc protease
MAPSCMGTFIRQVLVRGRCRIGLLLSLSCVLACSAGNPTPKVLPSVDSFTLANGLQVVLHRAPGVPLVMVSMCFAAGAADDPPGKTGLAHVVEHVIVRGLSAEINPDRNNTDGQTSFDTTCYEQRLGADRLDVGLRQAKSRLFGQPVVSKERLAIELQAVAQEFRERFENRPDIANLMALRGAAWPEFASWDYIPLGRKRDVASISVHDVEIFLQTWYQPSAATLVVVGDFDPSWAEGRIRETLGAVASRPVPARKAFAKDAKLTRHRRVVGPSGAAEHRLTYLSRSPGPFEQGDAELLVLSRILGGRGGRISEAFRAVGIEAEAHSIVDYEVGIGVFGITVTVPTDVPMLDIERLVEDVSKRLIDGPPTAEEHAEAVALVENDLVFELDSLSGRARRLQLYRRYLGRADGGSQDFGRFRKTTPQDIQMVARRLLDQSHRVEVVASPGERARAAAP